jgi:hypothetical protein
MSDWDEIRRNKMSDVSPSEWPKGVRAISTKGLALLGIHERTDSLYWDGKEIVIRKIRLGTFERWIGSIAAAGTFGTFLINIGRANGWWS